MKNYHFIRELRLGNKTYARQSHTNTVNTKYFKNKTTN